MQDRTPSFSADFSVGEFTVHVDRNVIVRGKETTEITPKMLAVITELAKHQDSTLSKEHLMTAVWGTTVTSDMVLSRAISDLRKVFGDSAKQQSYIQTISKQGYRLIKEVEWFENSTTESLKVKSVFFQRLIIIIFSFLTLAALLSYTFYPSSQPRITSTVATLKNITENIDKQSRLRFSANGDLLAYIQQSPSKLSKQLLTKNINNNVVSIIKTFENSEDVSVAFSPLGDKLAIRAIINQSCTLSIFNLLNHKERLLTNCPQSWSDSIDWSPNGQYITIPQFDTDSNTQNLLLVDIKSGETTNLASSQKELTGYFHARFSYSGSKLAVIYLSANVNVWEIGLIDVNTRMYKTLFKVNSRINQVVWGETDNLLYYNIDADIDSGIWQFDLAKMQSRHIARAKDISSLDFDQKNKQFAYIENSNKQEVWQTSVDKKGIISNQKVSLKTQRNSLPIISPNGLQLAYVSRNSNSDSLYLYYIKNKQDKLIYQLENGKIDDISWFPDQKSLYVTIIEDNLSKLIQINLVSGKVLIKNNKGENARGRISPKQDFSIWANKSEETWKIIKEDIQNNLLKSISVNTSYQYAILDDERLYYNKFGADKFDIYAKDINNISTPDELIIKSNSAFSWYAYSDSIYYAPYDIQKKQFILKYLNIHTMKSTDLFPISIEITSGYPKISATQNGKTAYYIKNVFLRNDMFLLSNDSNH